MATGLSDAEGEARVGRIAEGWTEARIARGMEMRALRDIAGRVLVDFVLRLRLLEVVWI